MIIDQDKRLRFDCLLYVNVLNIVSLLYIIGFILYVVYWEGRPAGLEYLFSGLHVALFTLITCVYFFNRQQNQKPELIVRMYQLLSISFGVLLLLFNMLLVLSFIVWGLNPPGLLP